VLTFAADEPVSERSKDELTSNGTRAGYGISISVQYLLSVVITSANAWNVTGLRR